jgi:type III secretion protein R
MQEGLPVFPLALAAIALSFLTIGVVCMTSFAKISVVLVILRNAMGMQQSPSNMVMNSVALLITAYIMSPMVGKIYNSMEKRDFELRNFEDYQSVFIESKDTIMKFLLQHSDPVGRAMLTDTAKKLWPKEAADAVKETDFLIVVPAFTLSELTQAFKIGFLLYIPFLAIDIAVTCIILAMGVSQVQPNVIATPMKLLLFVAIDGWTKIISGLILTYATV